ncbi:secreted antigen 1 [Babesia divergens]|uniref:Secreted antigen 1 n=1 Tax=Babesia divergens TaxID=32595 RepID=A0AAD9G5G8_BABDI|nr:secreted antigen 1 [Babesia divergens]
MNFLGILRASALYLLAIGFHGQPVSCGLFNRILSSKKPSNEPSTVEVSEVSENLEDSTVESSSQESLPSSQSALVFQRPSWHDSHLASAVLFLDKFCRDLTAKKFDGKLSDKKLYEDIKAVCRGRYFIPTYGPGAVAGRIEIPKNFYEGILEPKDFDVYVKWLVKNIPEIWKSYKQMLLESLDMTKEQLKTDNTVGPLKYGFVFTGVRWNAILPQWLNIDDESPLTLLVTLEKLQHCLKRVLKSYPRRSSVVPSVVEEAENSTCLRKGRSLMTILISPMIPILSMTESGPIKEAEKSNKEHEPYHVARKTKTDVTSDPSTINLPDGSKNPDGSMATPSPNGAAEDMEAEQEERLKEMQEISEDLKESPVESSSQSGLVFESSEWDVSQLASTIAFIKEFCEEVKGYKFSGNISEDKIMGLSGACSWVSFYLKSFSWRRVRGLRENPYEDALKPEKFKDYAEWFNKHYPEIFKSMINMYNEALKLSEKQLETATSSGPYKYGFVQNDDWWKILLSGWLGGPKGGNPITFLYTIDKLHKRLGDILNGPKEFTVSQSFVPAPKSNLVFQSSEWNDSHLASSVLFLEEFCKDVISKKFNGKLSEAEYDHVSRACVYLSFKLESVTNHFAPAYGPGTVTERKEIDMDFYKDVLKPEQFQVYVRWLAENIPEIWASVRQMSMEYLCMSETQLKTETSVGPLRYGFVYTGKPWGELTHGVNRGLFKDSDILQSLENLRSSLDDILGNSITKKILNFFSREKKSDVNSQQEDSTVKSQAA